jgi:uncharacterized protein YprB with RNaseH-like and TPR domain
VETRDRLRRALQEAGLSQRTPPAAVSGPAYQPALTAEPPAGPGIESFLPGFWQDTPAGRVFVVEQRFDLDHKHGSYPLGRTLGIPGEILARIGRQEALAGLDHRRLLYLDTETTGLAGGTGTLAFLVGIGHFLDGGFRLRQYFLDSLDKEEALLRALADYFQSFDAVVTYNGKIFDVPLLETRFILSRLPSEIRSLPHVDLLFAARRMYRDRFGSCRLGEIERQVLGLTRIEDVPGFEVPALYFRYQRSRRFRALVPVFEHNALDVLSLVTLMAHMGSIFADPESCTVEDRLALARICERDGHEQEAILHYTAAIDVGLPPVPRDEAERRLALLHKRNGDWEEAVAIWYRMAYRPGNRLLFPLVELAGYCERQRRDFEAAQLHVENALNLLRDHHLRLGARNAPAQELVLERRLARLATRRARASKMRGKTPLSAMTESPR